jgi:hypothetical protein
VVYIFFPKKNYPQFYSLMELKWSNRNKTEVEAFAVMLSWALYGAAMNWMQNQTTKLEDYVKQLMYFIKNGINMDKEYLNLI